MGENNMIASHFLASAIPNEAIGYTAQWSIINKPNRKIRNFGVITRIQRLLS